MPSDDALVHLVAPEDRQVLPRPSILRALLLTAVVLTAFALTCQLLRANLPRFPGLTPTHKFEFFEKHRDEYDTVFIGPSSVYRHVEPHTFDTVLAEHGVPCTSFNFGVNAITSLETLYTLDRILQLQPARLKRVFIELRGHGLEVWGRNARTQRFLSWHDAAITWRAINMLVESEAQLDWKLRNLHKHARAFSFRFTNLGHLRQILADHVGGTQASRSQLQADRRQLLRTEIGEAGNGFVSLTEAERTDSERRENLAARRRYWLAWRHRILKQVEDHWKPKRPLLSVSGTRRRDQRLTAGEKDLISAIVSLVERHGCEAIFFNSPDVLQREYALHAANREGLLPTFLNLDDKERYPHLFTENMWFDHSHLNDRGAQHYSEALAHRFAEQIETGGNVP